MSVIKKSLSIVRSGEFSIRTYGSSHCGTATSFKVKYHLKTVCSPRLDRRGFLFDQVNVQKFFDSIKRTSLSCEQLTERSLDRVIKMIMVENPICEMYSAQLTLSPEPFLASMTAERSFKDYPLVQTV